MPRSSLVALLVLGSLVDTVVAAAEPASPPNVLFLFADDQRADTIAAWGNDHIETPHLNRLVARGFSFRRNYCMGSTHGAVCQPSRAMLMSGRTLYRVKMDLAGAKLLPELLGENGYVTFATGKWHNGQESFLRAFQQGSAVFFGGMADHTQVPVYDVSNEHTLVNQRTGEKFSSELFADAAIDFLHAQDGTKPFFAYVAFTAPHDPRQPPEPYRQHYYDHLPPLPDNYMPLHMINNGWLIVRDENLAPWPRPPEMIRDQLAEYYGMITHLDAQVGRILKALEASVHARNTLIVYTADHGLALGSHGLLGKQNLYEHSMRSPLIVAGPRVPHGESRALTYLYDLYPTLCDVAGIAVPDEIEGHSLRAIWEGKADKVRDSLFLTFEDKMRAVRDERWKLIQYPQIHYTQLFDLQDDPEEQFNLADVREHREHARRLVGLLREWQQRTGDEQPLLTEERQRLHMDLTGYPREPDQWQPEWIVRKYFAKPADPQPE